MTRRLIATAVTLAGYWLVKLGLRIAGVKMRVSVVQRGHVYPSSWTSAHEQVAVNTVPPRESN